MNKALGALILLVTVSVAGAEEAEPDTKALEDGYREMSELVAECVRSVFMAPEDVEPILAGIKKANAQLEEAFAASSKVLGKSHTPIAQKRSGLQLIAVSSSPPSLRQDRDDLYRRFHSKLVVTFQAVDASGEPVGTEPFRVAVDVFADRHLAWSVPRCEGIIAALTKTCNESAASTLQSATHIYEQTIELKNLKRQNAAREAEDARARKAHADKMARAKADDEKFLSSLKPWMRREIEKGRRKAKEQRKTQR